MEIAEVRQKFEKVRETRRVAAQLRAKADTLRLSATGGAIRYDKDKVQTSPDNYQERWLVEAADLDRQADKLIRKGEKDCAQLYEWLGVCSNEEYIVLANHYINDKSFREIEFEYSDAFKDKTYVGAFRYAQNGIQKISENF